MNLSKDQKIEVVGFISVCIVIFGISLVIIGLLIGINIYISSYEVSLFNSNTWNFISERCDVITNNITSIRVFCPTNSIFGDIAVRYPAPYILISYHTTCIVSPCVLFIDNQLNVEETIKLYIVFDIILIILIIITCICIIPSSIAGILIYKKIKSQSAGNSLT